MKLRLIDDWHRSWKFATVQLAAVFTFLFAIGPDLLHAWSLMPDDLKNALPEGVGRWIAVAAFVLVLLGRIFQLDRKAS